MNVTTVLATLHMGGLHTLQMVPEVVTRADDMLNSTINTRGGGVRHIFNVAHVHLDSSEEYFCRSPERSTQYDNAQSTGDWPTSTHTSNMNSNAADASLFPLSMSTKPFLLHQKLNAPLPKPRML